MSTNYIDTRNFDEHELYRYPQPWEGVKLTLPWGGTKPIPPWDGANSPSPATPAGPDYPVRDIPIPQDRRLSDRGLLPRAGQPPPPVVSPPPPPLLTSPLLKLFRRL